MKRTPLKRTSSLKRSRLSRVPKKRSEGMRGVSAWEHQRGPLERRSDGRCENCGRWVGSLFEIHHRRLRSRRGSDQHALSNLLATCGSCHGWIHHNPTEATRLGVMVPSWADPAETPVTLHDGRLTFLTSDGGYWLAAPPFTDNPTKESA